MGAVVGMSTEMRGMSQLMTQLLSGAGKGTAGDEGNDGDDERDEDIPLQPIKVHGLTKHRTPEQVQLAVCRLLSAWSESSLTRLHCRLTCRSMP